MAGINHRVKNPIYDASSSKGSSLKACKGSYRRLNKQAFKSRMGITAAPKQIVNRPLRPISNRTRDNLSLKHGLDDDHHLLKRMPVYAKHVGKQKPLETSFKDEFAGMTKDLMELSGEETREISVDEILATSNLAGLPPGYRPVRDEREENGSSHDSIVNSEEDDIAGDEGGMDGGDRLECYVSLSPLRCHGSMKGTLEPDASLRHPSAIGKEVIENVPSQSRPETKTPRPTTSASPSSSTVSGWQEQETLTSINDDVEVESFGSAYDRMSDAREDELGIDSMDTDEEGDGGMDAIFEEQRNDYTDVTRFKHSRGPELARGPRALRPSAYAIDSIPEAESRRDSHVDSHETSRYFPMQGPHESTGTMDATDPNRQYNSGRNAAADSAMGTWPPLSSTVTSGLSDCPSSSALARTRILPPPIYADALICPPCPDEELQDSHSQYQRSDWNTQRLSNGHDTAEDRVDKNTQFAAGIVRGTQADEYAYHTLGRSRSTRNASQEVQDRVYEAYLQRDGLPPFFQDENMPGCDKELDNSTLNAVSATKRLGFGRSPSATTSELTDSETAPANDLHLKIWDAIESGPPDRLRSTPHAGTAQPVDSSRQRHLKSELSLEREAWQVSSDDRTVEDDTGAEGDDDGEKTGSDGLCDDHDAFRPRAHARIQWGAMRQPDEAMENYPRDDQLAHWENYSPERWSGRRQLRCIIQDEDGFPLTRSTFKGRTGGDIRVRRESTFGSDTVRARYPLLSQIDAWKRKQRNSMYQESEEDQEIQELEDSEIFDGDVGEDGELLGEDGLTYEFEAFAMTVEDEKLDETESQEPFESTYMPEKAAKDSPASSDTLLDCIDLSPMIATERGMIQQELPTFEQVVVIYNYPEDNHRSVSVESIDESDRNAEDKLPIDAPSDRLDEKNIVQEVIMYLETLVKGFTVRDIEDHADNANEGARMDEQA
ncbi:hypothetical protein QFC21_004493 [Naganishia friedmannii]|uniref:Uncharacterized protein n=1 Tax=Naganishia friedmannii TaxID=89922 RepID=A0ACC2VG76_9TREE|nr:hypothetical protein QFC21_004493 [Naganishia friedmannii]